MSWTARCHHSAIIYSERCMHSLNGVSNLIKRRRDIMQLPNGALKKVHQKESESSHGGTVVHGGLAGCDVLWIGLWVTTFRLVLCLFRVTCLRLPKIYTSPTARRTDACFNFFFPVRQQRGLLSGYRTDYPRAGSSCSCSRAGWCNNYNKGIQPRYCISSQPTRTHGAAALRITIW
jgi:hypothetical protein